MAEVMILTQTCDRDEINGREESVRDTWLRKWGHLVEHRFIFSGSQGSDKVWGFDVPDGYDYVAFKVQAAMNRAYNLGVQHVFYCDTDTFVHVPRLLASGYGRAPYIGLRCDEGHASGGAGFWVSGRAIEVLAAATPTTGYSDMWVGDHLARAGITLTHDPRYHGVEPPNFGWPDTISAHLCGNVDRMYKFGVVYCE